MSLQGFQICIKVQDNQILQNLLRAQICWLAYKIAKLFMYYSLLLPICRFQLQSWAHCPLISRCTKEKHIQSNTRVNFLKYKNRLMQNFRAGIPNLSTTAILDQLLLWCGGQSCAMQDVQQHPWPLLTTYPQHIPHSPAMTIKNLLRHC